MMHDPHDEVFKSPPGMLSEKRTHTTSQQRYAASNRSSLWFTGLSRGSLSPWAIHVRGVSTETAPDWRGSQQPICFKTASACV